MNTSEAFILQSRYYLQSDYLPKIARCLSLLEEAQIWWRPHGTSNSIGNLVLHLSGNVRQWVISGVGGVADTRARQQEFDERREIPKQELLNLLRETLMEVDQVLAKIDPSSLLEKREVQGQHVTVLQAIYHAVEHFSTHTGQIIYITKMMTGADLAFYEVKDGIATPLW